MKVIIASGIFPPDIGGPASYVPKITKSLVDRGHEVTVICLSDDTKIDDSDYNFKVIRISRQLFLPFRILISAYKIWSKALKSDIIFANTFHVESAIGAFFSNSAIVHKIVGDYAWERACNKGWYSGTINEYQSRAKSLKLFIYDWLIKFPFRFSSQIIVPSEFSKNIVQNWKGISQHKIKVIYNSINGIDFPEKLNSTIRSQSHTWITICRLTKYKGVEEIILNMQKLPNDKLVVIGDGPELHNLENLTSKLGLKDKVTFSGAISNFETISELRNSDFFILNSKGENFPNVILEAMACGIPVICNNVGGCGEIVKHMETGYLIDNSIANRMLIDGMLTFRNDKELSEKLSINAKQIVLEHFSFQYMVDQTENLLIETLKNN